MKIEMLDDLGEVAEVCDVAVVDEGCEDEGQHGGPVYAWKTEIDMEYQVCAEHLATDEFARLALEGDAR